LGEDFTAKEERQNILWVKHRALGLGYFWQWQRYRGFKASNVVGTANEVRPATRRFIIWKRTAALANSP
jgi:hypothetical protein